MKTVNAGIKSKEELRKRLESGETGLTIDGRELKFVESNIYEGKGAYLAEDENYGFVDIYQTWKVFADVEKQVNWEDEVGHNNPVLCWVSSENEEERQLSAYIDYKTPDGQYGNSSYRIYWVYATPVKPSDCWGYEE